MLEGANSFKLSDDAGNVCGPTPVCESLPLTLRNRPPVQRNLFAMLSAEEGKNRERISAGRMQSLPKTPEPICADSLIS